MSWLNRHQRALQLIILALLLIASTGPWGYDLIDVPAQYDCPWPNFRLEGDFCGVPFSGMSAIVAGVRAIFGSLAGVIKSGTIQTELALDFWVFFIILTPLPVFGVLLLLILGEQLRLRAFYEVALGLAIAGSIGFLLIWNISLRGLPPIQLWGFWIYILLALAAILLETTVIMGKKREI